MRLGSRHWIAFAFFGCLAETAGSATDLDRLLDIDSVDRSGLAVCTAPVALSEVRESELLLNRRDAPRSPDRSLGRPLSRIALHAEVLAGIASTTGNLRSIAGCPLVAFELAGHLIRMPLVEVRHDAAFDALHLTLVAPDSADYIRLTVSGSGAEVVGTAVIGGDEFRLLPGENGYQYVYPVVYHAGEFRRERATDFESRAGRLEARHLQLTWYAARRPMADHYSAETDGRPSLYIGPSLGAFELSRAVTVYANGLVGINRAELEAETEAFMNRIRHFFWSEDPFDIVLEPRVRIPSLAEFMETGIEFDAVQHIDGVPISADFTLRVNSNGEVVKYYGVTVPPRQAQPASRLTVSAEEARRIAEAVVLEEHKIDSAGEYTEENLVYQIRSLTELTLMRRLHFRSACGLWFRARIDAISGEAVTVYPSLPLPFAGEIDVESELERCRQSIARQ